MTSFMCSVGVLFCLWVGWFGARQVKRAGGWFVVLNVGVGKWFGALGSCVRDAGKRGVGEGVFMASRWSAFVTSLADVSRSSCSLLTCSFRFRASSSSSFASAIWLTVAARMALQNDAQVACPDPVTFCRAFGIDLRTELISSPLVSGIAAASLSTLSAHTMWASSS